MAAQKGYEFHMISLRLFIAVELDEPTGVALAEVQRRLRQQIPDGSVRWVNPENIHLTLKFLGDTPSARVPEIKQALSRAVAGVAPFGVRVAGRGCFPNFHQPRVLWVGLEPAGVTQPLAGVVEQALEPLGWSREQRPFRPHLTLGRIARGASKPEAAQAGQIMKALELDEVSRMRVEEVTLMQSDLRSQGPIYRALHREPLVAD